MLIDGNGDPISADPWHLLPLPTEEKPASTTKVPGAGATPASAASVKASHLTEHTVLPLAVWKDWDVAERKTFLKLRHPGLLIPGELTREEFLEELGDASVIKRFGLLAVRIPGFADGRAFSLIRRIREQDKYAGELRVMGEYLTDQLYFLRRCGADSYVLGEKDNLTDIKRLLSPFSNNYQNLPSS